MSTVNRGIIQPSARFVEEMKTADVKQALAPAIAKPLPPPPPPLATTQTSAPSVDNDASLNTSTPASAAAYPASSIYPEAHLGNASAISSGRSFEQVEIGKNLKQVVGPVPVAIVFALGGLITLASAYSLFIIIQLTSSGYISVLGYLEAVVTLILGVGIMMRYELARMLYVFVSILVLAVSTYSLYRVIKIEHTIHTSTVAELANANQRLVGYQNSNTYTPSQKQTFINITQNEIASIQKYEGQYNKQFLLLIPGYLIAILPLIILTRPQIKAVFDK